MTAALLAAGTVPPSTAGQLAESRQAAVVVPAPRPAGELTVGAGEDTTFPATSAATRALDQVRPEYADVVVWLSQHLARSIASTPQRPGSCRKPVRPSGRQSAAGLWSGPGAGAAPPARAPQG